MKAYLFIRKKRERERRQTKLRSILNDLLLFIYSFKLFFESDF